MFFSAEQDHLLKEARALPPTADSFCAEETETLESLHSATGRLRPEGGGGCCRGVLLCLGLGSGLLAAALAGAAVGYEVGIHDHGIGYEFPWVTDNDRPRKPKTDEQAGGQHLRGDDGEHSSTRSATEPPMLTPAVTEAPPTTTLAPTPAPTLAPTQAPVPPPVPAVPSVKPITEEQIQQEDAEWLGLQVQWQAEQTEWRKLHAPGQMVFYMYRAQSSKDYPPVNINTADLNGVLWYLHNEIVGMTPRKYEVKRILRFKVTVNNTEKLRNQVFHRFGAFVAFDSGRCTVPTCDQIWNQYGFVVGCQVIGAEKASYSRQAPCNPASCQAGIWYSLPGPCPTVDFTAKTDECKKALPGGECGSAAVTGEADCTYHVEEAGAVDLDEFSFITNYTGFIAEGRREYDALTDKGVNFSFWDGIRNQTRCTWRMNRLQLLFKCKYPDLPALLDPPPCPD
mmetsp:Transcript_12513/g.34504  ORF Transcript_12513/g.34504 Transcript_12513/m.34504 type:complete len:453 (-) Transcript_12513:68-1426(-)